VARGHSDRSQMLRALDRALEQLRRHYSFLTVPELLRQGPPVRVNWYEKTPPEIEPALRRQVAALRQ
jgi:hypothetical protein